MRESARAVLAPGVVFLVLGALLFFVNEKIAVKVEFMPVSFMLIMLCVAGTILFGTGMLMFLLDRFSD